MIDSYNRLRFTKACRRPAVTFTAVSLTFDEISFAFDESVRMLHNDV